MEVVVGVLKGQQEGGETEVWKVALGDRGEGAQFSP